MRSSGRDGGRVPFAPMRLWPLVHLELSPEDGVAVGDVKVFVFLAGEGATREGFVLEGFVEHAAMATRWIKNLNPHGRSHIVAS